MEIKQEIAQVQKRPETFADIRKETEARFRELVEAWMQRRSTFQTTLGAMQAFNNVFDRLEAAHKRERTIDENTSDGYHTFQELYRYRMLYNAAFFNMLARHTDIPVVKSRRHGDGEPCFGGGWFIVMAQLPTGQVSNHYEDRYWDLFYVPEAEKAPVWDGHTPNEAADRLESFLEMRDLLTKSPENVNSASISDSRDNCGDAAKLREALEDVLEKIDRWRTDGSMEHWQYSQLFDIADAALAAPLRNCIDKVFVLVKADAFGDKMDQYEVFSSFQSANEWMRRDYISQQRKEEMVDSMGVMKDDPAFFHDQPVPSSDSESAELFLGESHVVRWCIYEKELITEGGGDADK